MYKWFYHLIKTHKTGPDITIRPIVSNTNGPTQRIAWLLANALKQITGINIAFYRLANQIRWKHFRESNLQPSDFLTYQQTRHIYRTEPKDELERKLQRIHHKHQVTLKALQPQQKWSNISHADKKAIKELKEKNYVCLASDKGTEFCVIQQDTYTQVALDHLSDSNTYQKVPRMSAKTVENKINSTCKNICPQNEFPHPLFSEKVSSPQTPICPVF